MEYVNSFISGAENQSSKLSGINQAIQGNKDLGRPLLFPATFNNLIYLTIRTQRFAGQLPPGIGPSGSERMCLWGLMSKITLMRGSKPMSNIRSASPRNIYDTPTKFTCLNSLNSINLPHLVIKISRFPPVLGILLVMCSIEGKKCWKLEELQILRYKRQLLWQLPRGAKTQQKWTGFTPERFVLFYDMNYTGEHKGAPFARTSRGNSNYVSAGEGHQPWQCLIKMVGFYIW